MMATSNLTGGATEQLLEFQYKEDTRFVDSSPHHSYISLIRYFEDADLIAVVEEGSLAVKLYDATCNLLMILNDDTVLPGTMAEESTKEKEGGLRRVYDVEYMQEENLIAVSTSTLDITLWMYELGATTADLAGRLVGSQSQMRLKWSPSQLTLFSASITGELHAWDLTMRCPKKTLDSHRACIMALLVIREHGLLVTASLDRLIRIYSVDKLKLLHTLRGHKKGVRMLSWGHNRLFSCGFEYTAYSWTVLGTAKQDLTMRGHRASLLTVEPVLSKTDQPRVVTMDEAMLLKLWDVNRATATNRSAQCLQTLALTGDIKCLCVPRRPATSSRQYRHLISAGHKLRIIRRLEPEKISMGVSSAFYSPTSLQFVGAVGCNVFIWDALDSKLLRIFNDISPSDISAMTLDARERVLILGNAEGHVVAYNYINGMPLRSASKMHTAEVSAMIYDTHDSLLITASIDRRIHIYQDGEELRLVRSVTEAHKREINRLAFSYDLSLLASADTGGLIHLWDYQTIRFLGLLRMDAELVGLHFLPNRAGLIGVTAGARVALWALRPHSSAMRCLASWQAETAPTITTSALRNDDEQLTLALGSSSGLVILIDVKQQLLSKLSPPLPPLPPGKRPLNDTGLEYNPRRHLHREMDLDLEYRKARREKHARRLSMTRVAGDLMASLASAMMPSPPGSPPSGTVSLASIHAPKIGGSLDLESNRWVAFEDDLPVAALVAVADPPSLMSLSGSKLVKLWAWDGELYGKLTTDKDTVTVRRGAEKWTYPVNMRDRVEGRSSPTTTPATRRSGVFKPDAAGSAVSLAGSGALATKMKAGDAEESKASPADVRGPRAGSPLISKAAMEVERATRATKKLESRRRSLATIAPSLTDPMLERAVVRAHERELQAEAALAAAPADGSESDRRRSSLVEPPAGSRPDELVAVGLHLAEDLARPGTGTSARPLSPITIRRPQTSSVAKTVDGRVMYQHMYDELQRRSVEVGRRKLAERTYMDTKPSDFLADKLGGFLRARDKRRKGGRRKGDRRRKPRARGPAASRGSRSMLPALDSSPSPDRRRRTGGLTASHSVPALGSKMTSPPPASSSFFLTEVYTDGEEEGDGGRSHRHRLTRAGSSSRLPSGRLTSIPVIGMPKGMSVPTGRAPLRRVKAAVRPRVLEVEDKLARSLALPAIGEMSPAEAAEAAVRAAAAEATAEAAREERSESGEVDGDDAATVLRSMKIRRASLTLYSAMLGSLEAEEEEAKEGSAASIASDAKRESFADARRLVKSFVDDLGLDDDGGRRAKSKVHGRHDSTLALWRSYRAKRARGKRKGRARHIGPYTLKEVKEVIEAFNQFDRDGSGSLDMSEFLQGTATWAFSDGATLQRHMQSLFSTIDRDQSGSIELRELLRVMFPKACYRDVQQMLKLGEKMHSKRMMSLRNNAKFAGQLSDEQLMDVKALFKVYDMDTRAYSAMEWKDSVRKMGWSLSSYITQDDLMEMFRKFKIEYHTVLKLDEFMSLLRQYSHTKRW
eukprot:PLAT3980.1.p1 GENE.PLAT3980.1~~PLAT3980.1.p1  ORF type:complete len:1717 (+),score=708.84 PLAT3980.1:613-5151(+)